MKIIDNRPKNTTITLCDVENGDTFIYNEKLYLVVDEITAQCFCLTDNISCEFDNCEPIIEKVACSIFIEKE